MAQTVTVNLEVKTNNNEVQSQFDELRNSINRTSQEVDDLSKSYGENSEQADNARKELSKLNQAYDTLSKSATDLNATFEQVYGELQPLTTRMGEAEDRLYELALAGKQGTKEYNDLLQTVGNYRKVQIQTDLVVDAAATTMSQKLGGALSGISSGFELAQGVMGTFGVESAEVEKALLKVQSAMAISQGLQGVRESISSFKQLGAVASSTFKNLSSESSLAGKATSALGPIWKAVGLSGKTALTGIRAGIAATGIGLLVIALGTIVAYWDDIKAAVSGVSTELENNIELSKKQVEQAEKGVELFDLQENSLKLQGKSETEILQLRQDKLKLLAKEQEEDIKLAENKKKLEIAGAKRNKELLEGYLTLQIEGIMLPFRVLAGLVDATMLTINAGLRALGQDEIKFKTLNSYMTEFREYATDGLASMIFDPEGIAKESDKEITALKKALAKSKSEIDGAELQIRDIKKESNKKQAEDKKEADMSMTEYLDALEAKRKADITDAQEKELQALDDQYEALYAAADKAGVDTAELQKKQGEESRAIKDKYDKLAIEDAKNRDQEAIKQFIAGEQIKIDAMTAGLDKEAAIRKLAYDKGQIELQANLDANLITMDQFQTASRANYKAYQAGLAADRQAAYKSDLDAETAVYEQKAALQNQYADIASQAANLLKETLGKSKAAQKTAVIIESAAGIAKMIIANKLANLGALATPQAIATSGVAAAPVITANNISLGLGIAANVAATTKALKEIGGGGTAPSGGSTGGGGTATGGGGAGVTAPNFNVVGNNGLNQLAQLQMQPVKAYVVGSEVSTQQALDRNRITNSTL